MVAVQRLARGVTAFGALAMHESDGSNAGFVGVAVSARPVRALVALTVPLAARARFHAAWWDDPRLGISVGTWLCLRHWQKGSPVPCRAYLQGWGWQTGSSLPSSPPGLLNHISLNPVRLSRKHLLSP